MVKQIGRSVSPFAVIAIWECEKCRNSWTSSGDTERCPYCQSVRFARTPKSWVPFFLSRSRTTRIGWNAALMLGLVAWGGVAALYLFNQYMSSATATAFRNRFVARRHQPRHASEKSVKPIKTEWKAAATEKA